MTIVSSEVAITLQALDTVELPNINSLLVEAQSAAQGEAGNAIAKKICLILLHYASYCIQTHALANTITKFTCDSYSCLNLKSFWYVFV